MFDSPRDALIWDVSHQCYAHKILTGRNGRFETLRQKDGLAGFTKHEESVHDWFDAGHASTSISSALGLLVGRRLRREDGKVIAVIGDGALTGGMALEALSHAGQLSKDLVIILNDNQMSINGNTGALSRYLSRLTTTAQYQTFRYNFDRIAEKIPFIGKRFMNLVFRLKRAVKGLIFPSNFFSDLGFEYVGPLNGHNLEQMIAVFKRIQKLHRPVVVHLVTQKGRGYAPAENDPVTYHGVAPASSSKRPVNFTDVFASAIVRRAQEDERVVAVTAAMTDGTGLTEFRRRFPDRFFDVGGGYGGSLFLKLFGGQLNQLAQKADVFPFVFSADIVGLSGSTLVQNEPYGAVVIFDKKPIADVFAVAVDGKFFFPLNI